MMRLRVIALVASIGVLSAASPGDRPAASVDEVAVFGRLCIDYVMQKRYDSELFTDADWGVRQPRSYNTETSTESRTFVPNKNILAGITFGESKHCMVTTAVKKLHVEDDGGSATVESVFTKLNAEIEASHATVSVTQNSNDGSIVFQTEAFSVELSSRQSPRGDDEIAFQIVIARTEPSNDLLKIREAEK